VPYRRTLTKHILVRAKINGKGPFNFIIDSGAPLVFLNTDVGKKLGLTIDPRTGAATLDRLEVEGGVVLNKVRVRVETPFQLEGMNALGMPGVELHGVFGYTLLSRFKLEFDPTKDSMTWTKLDFTPPAPQSLGAKGPEGLDGLGKMMKAFAALMGIKGAPQPMLRGFVGVQLSEVNKGVVVQAVLANSPAATAGVQIGDRVLTVQGTEVATAAEVMTLLAKVLPGQQVSFVVERGEGRKEISITAGEGI
jgi:hypothetical protein